MTTYTITEQQRLEALDALYLPFMKTEAMLRQKDKAYVMLQSLQPNTQEPVGWQYKKENSGVFVSDQCPADVEVFNDIEWSKPLYTHPAPQQKPLTEVLDELENCMDLLNLAFPSAPIDSCIGAAITKAHAVLKAHGVKP